MSSSEPSELASESASLHLPVQDDRHPAAADVHSNAGEQKTKSDSTFVCHLSVLTVSMCRYYVSFIFFCLSALERSRLAREMGSENILGGNEEIRSVDFLFTDYILTSPMTAAVVPHQQSEDPVSSCRKSPMSRSLSSYYWCPAGRRDQIMGTALKT